jgi:molecular chaperone GrpE
MQPKDKVEQLRQSLQAKKAAEELKVETAAAEAYKSKVRELEQSLEKALVECEALKKKAGETHDDFLRKHAEFENYRKRVNREKEEMARYGSERLARELLPVIDGLEKTLEHADEATDFKLLIEGVELVLKQFLNVLQKFGLYPVESVGQPFNPEIHEAMGHHESEEHEPDTVVQEYRRGYKMHERLLRPAMVTVAKPPEPKKEEPPEGKK